MRSQLLFEDWLDWRSLDSLSLNSVGTLLIIVTSCIILSDEGSYSICVIIKSYLRHQLLDVLYLLLLVGWKIWWRAGLWSVSNMLWLETTWSRGKRIGYIKHCGCLQILLEVPIMSLWSRLHDLRYIFPSRLIIVIFGFFYLLIKALKDYLMILNLFYLLFILLLLLLLICLKNHRVLLKFCLTVLAPRMYIILIFCLIFLGFYKFYLQFYSLKCLPQFEAPIILHIKDCLTSHKCQICQETEHQDNREAPSAELSERWNNYRGRIVGIRQKHEKVKVQS